MRFLRVRFSKTQTFLYRKELSKKIMSLLYNKFNPSRPRNSYRFDAINRYLGGLKHPAKQLILF
jgi:hypothetical protein